MKIKHSLQIILLILTIIPIVTFGYYMIQYNSDHIEKIVSENLQVVSNTQIADIRNFCKQREDNLTILSQLDMVIDTILDKNSSRYREQRYLNNFLETRVENNEFSESFTIVDRELNIIACSEKRAGKKASRLESAKELFEDGNLYFSNILNLDLYGSRKQVVVVIKGIFYEEKLIGYILEEINLLFFEQIRMESGLWKDGTLYLTDGNGKLITAGEKNEESRKEFVSSKEERKEFSEKWNQIDFEKNPEGEIRYHMNGIEYITYYAGIDYTNWKIMLTVNLSNSLKYKEQSRILGVISVFTMIIIMLCMNKFVSIKITNPIEQISYTLHKIKENNDYTLRIEDKGTNEITELSQEINELIGYIEKENLYEKEQKRKLKQKAERDSLTKVFNKETIENQLKRLLKICQQEKQGFVLVFVDVDNFKQFNTNYGHMVGDQVLQFVASTLIKETKGVVGRVGGDEFVVGMNVLDMDYLKVLFSNIVKMFNKKFVIEGTKKQVAVPCSIGIAISKDGSASYESLLVRADDAMFQTKENGKNGFSILED